MHHEVKRPFENNEIPSENSFSVLEEDKDDEDEISENESELNVGLIIEEDRG